MWRKATTFQALRDGNGTDTRTALQQRPSGRGFRISISTQHAKGLLTDVDPVQPFVVTAKGVTRVVPDAGVADTKPLRGGAAMVTTTDVAALTVPTVAVSVNV